MGVDLLVIYMQYPGDENRHWKKMPAQGYKEWQCQRLLVGKVVIYWLPIFDLLRYRDRIVLLDNNPTNICMLIYAVLFKSIGVKTALWIEHINDDFKSVAKQTYQKICSWLLIKLTSNVLYFSDMTKSYVQSLASDCKMFRIRQAVGPTAEFPNTGILCQVPRRGLSIIKFGYIGSLTVRKNVSVLLEIFSEYTIKKAELHTAGFENTLGNRGNKNIRYYGYIDGEQKENFYEDIDCLILPSLADPWGMVVNEAMSRGCLCIVSEQCGSSEMIRQVDSRLVTGTDKSSIRAAIDYVLNLTADEIYALRSKSLQVIADYTLDKSASDLFCALLT